MQLDQSVARAIAESHARDRLAYFGLSASRRTVADRVAKLLFRVRMGISGAWHWTLRGSEQVLRVALDWLLWLGDKLLFGPYRVALRFIIALGRALASALKQLVGVVLDVAGALMGALDGFATWLASLLPTKESGGGLLAFVVAVQQRARRLRRLLPVLKRIWQRAIERAWRRLGPLIKSGIAELGRGVDWVSRNMMFRPLVWLFNPRLPGGRPLLGNETATRIAGFVLAMAALYAGVLLIAFVKAKALLLHGSINGRLWKGDAPVLLNVIKIGAAHAAIAVGVLASKVVLLPVVAAARRGIKNNALTQAIAYRYVKRKQAAERLVARQGNAAGNAGGVTPPGPLGFVDRLVEHIVAGTVPEAYEVKLQQQDANGASGSRHLATKPDRLITKLQ